MGKSKAENRNGDRGIEGEDGTSLRHLSRFTDRPRCDIARRGVLPGSVVWFRWDRGIGEPTKRRVHGVTKARSDEAAKRAGSEPGSMTPVGSRQRRTRA